MTRIGTSWENPTHVQIAGMFDDSADSLKTKNTTDTQHLKGDVNFVDEYFDETNKERLPVMHNANYVDNGGRTLSERMAEVPYMSSRKIQKQYVNISTGATIPISVLMNYFDKLKPRFGEATKHKSVLKNESMKMVQKTHDCKPDRNLFHSDEMKSHDIKLLTDVPNFNGKHS